MNNPRKRYILSVILLLVLCLPFIIQTAVNPYYPTVDEAWQVQAAVRLGEGKGYTASFDDTLFQSENLIDLSNVNYCHLSGWPPGYSYFIALINLLFNNINVSLRIVSLFFLIIGLLFWLKIGISIFNYSIKFIIFCFLLLISAPFLRGTVLLQWSLFSIISYIVIYKDFNIRNIIITNLLLSGLVLLRYQAIVIIPSVLILWLLIINTRFSLLNNSKITITKIIYLCIPITLFVLLILWNKSNSNEISTIVTNKFHFNWMNFWIIDAISAVLLDPFLYKYLSSYIGIPVSLTIIISVFVFLVFAILLIIYRKGLFKQRFFQWGAINILFLVLFLFIIDILFTKNQRNDWSFVGETRYYSYLYPLIYASIITLLSSFYNKFHLKISLIHKIFSVIILLSLLIILYLNKYNLNKNESKNLETISKELNVDLNKISKDYQTNNSIVVANQPYARILLSEGKYAVFRRIEEVLENDNVYFSRKSLIIIVIDSNDVVYLEKVKNRFLHMNRNYFFLEGKMCNYIYFLTS